MLLAALGFFRNPASAQTSYSLRIYSLGESFAGLIDDPQSDAFLNPARVGDLRDRQLYMAKLPAGSTTFYYPDNYGSMSYAYSSLPPEAPPGEIDYKWPETYTPYTLGFVTPVTETVKLSLSLEAAAKGDDDLEGSEVLQVRGV